MGNKKTIRTKKESYANTDKNLGERSFRNGHSALEDPRIVDPRFRPSPSEINKIGISGQTSNLEKEAYEVIDLIREGYSLEYCRGVLSKKINDKTKRPYSPRFIQTIVLKANKVIQQYHKAEQYKVHHLHINRYNAMIRRLLQKEFEINPEIPWLARKLEIDALTEALLVMKQKEELLGIYRKSFKIEINNETNIQIVNGRSIVDGLDIDLLETQELIELHELITIMKTNVEEAPQGVLLTAEEIVQEQISNNPLEFLKFDKESNTDLIEILRPVIDEEIEEIRLETLTNSLLRKSEQELEESLQKRKSVKEILRKKIEERYR